MNKAFQHIDRLPPEQEAVGSNPTGRTSFQSFSDPPSAGHSDLPVNSAHHSVDSAHQLPTWERLRLLTERNRCRSEQFSMVFWEDSYRFGPIHLTDPMVQLGISDWFCEELLIERELTALEKSL